MYACVHNLKEEIVYAVRIQFEKGNSLRMRRLLYEDYSNKRIIAFLYMESLASKDIQLAPPPLVLLVRLAQL